MQNTQGISIQIELEINMTKIQLLSGYHQQPLYPIHPFPALI
jgi:hypothetical protein